MEGWTNSAASAAQLLDKPYPVTAVDFSDRQQINDRPQNFDLVIHCASTRGGDAENYRQLYLNGALNLLDRFVGSTVLFTSSTSVYAQTGGEAVNEQSPARPSHEKGQLLRETENLVLGRGGIVARLAGIHGPGRSAILTRFLQGDTAVDSINDRFMNHVHRDDIASALMLLAEASPRQNAVYNVTDDEPILRSACYQWLTEKLGRPPASKGKDSTSGKRGRSNKRVSNLKLRECGWRPRYPTFAAAMELSILPSFRL